MRIAFALTQSLDSPSGLGRYGPLARALARRGHEIELFALHYAWNDLPQKHFLDKGVLVNYVGQMHVRKEGPRKLYYGPVRLLTISLSSTMRLARALRRSTAEIIQVCKAQPYNVLAARLAKRGRAVYFDCDDYEAETNRFSARWQQAIVRYFEDGITSQAAGITANTQFTRQRYIDLGFPDERIVYVPNGVDRERFSALPDWPHLSESMPMINMLDRDAPLILYTGTLGLLSHPVDLLFEAFQRVLQEVPSAQLMLVGGGEDFDHLVEMSRDLGIDSRTFFAGRQPPDLIPAIISRAAVTVDPVRDDSIARARSPLKILESLASGIPSVTGDVGDRRQILDDGKSGVLVTPGSSAALAEGITTILADSQLRQSMAEHALSSRQRWYWEYLAEDFVKVYDL